MAGVRRHLPLLGVATVLAAVVAVVLTGPAGAACTPSHDLQQALTLLAPGLALLAPLLLGRYLGEDRIARAAARFAPRRRRAPVAAARAVVRPRAQLARGGALIAAALARRGPPALRNA